MYLNCLNHAKKTWIFLKEKKKWDLKKKYQTFVSLYLFIFKYQSYQSVCDENWF